jgi:hypothetical protein
MLVEQEVYTGKVEKDVFGSWDDCSPGLYIDHDMIDTIFYEYMGKNIRLTIEVIEKAEG